MILMYRIDVCVVPIESLNLRKYRFQVKFLKLANLRCLIRVSLFKLPVLGPLIVDPADYHC
jgi:hypothetical protein